MVHDYISPFPLYLHTILYKVALAKLIIQLARRVSVLCCPLHTKTTLLFCNATSLLDHLSSITMSSEFGVDEKVYAESAEVTEIVNRWQPLPSFLMSPYR